MDGVVAEFLIQLVEHSAAPLILGFSSFRFILTASHFRPGRRIETASRVYAFHPAAGNRRKPFLSAN